MLADDRSFVLERKRGVPEHYERPLLYPIGDFEGILMGDIVRVSDPHAAIELDRMGCYGTVSGLRRVAVSRICFPESRSRTVEVELNPDTQPSTSSGTTNSKEFERDAPLADRQLWIDQFPSSPTLTLSLEEALFLKFALNVLTVKDAQGNQLSLEEFWTECRKRIGESFVIRYAAYHYYRSRGWVVRSGLSFGVDYLLYKDGPEYHHSSFGVRILTDGDQIKSSHFGALNRVMSTVKKELIHCSISVPVASDFDVSTPNCVRSLHIKELRTRTWMSERNRD
uniref:tRNA-intron lyase n=1 Tax=Plectus sambesii TaxID=2011161 RepID=A0A914XAE7_9BILA